MHLLAQAYWLTASVAIAGILHMVAVKKDLLRGLKVPLDGGRTVGGKPIFGENKTWRGVVLMIAIPGIVGAVQGALLGAWAARRGIEAIDFTAAGGGSPAAGYARVGALLGLGYVLGELPNSFIKRRIDITPGKKGRGPLGWLFFALDQSDSVIAAMLVLALVFDPGWRFIVAAIFALSLLHFTIALSLYALRIKKEL